jgi:hypothetical protein
MKSSNFNSHYSIYARSRRRKIYDSSDGGGVIYYVLLEGETVAGCLRLLC